MNFDGFEMYAEIGMYLDKKPCKFDVYGIRGKKPKNLKVSLTGLGILNWLTGRLATWISQWLVSYSGDIIFLKLDDSKLTNFVKNYLNNNFDCNLISNLTNLL